MRNTACLLSIAAIVLAGCSTANDPNRRHSELRVVSFNSGPYKRVEIVQPILFSIPLNSPLYKNLDFELPGGAYELRLEDDSGFYFRAVNDRLKITAYGKPHGGFLVPRDQKSSWRVWTHHNYSAAIGVFGPAGAGMAAQKNTIMVMDPIPDDALGAVRALIAAFLEANQTAQTTPGLRPSVSDL